MKIALLNYSGNVGKTTLARDLFKLRLPKYEIVSIESVNNDGKENLLIRGEDGDKLYTELLLNDDMILDIGSSNLEAFFLSGKKEVEIINNIDIFILPVTPELKQQADTGKTLKSLLSAGVVENKIHVIPNQVIIDPHNPISNVFGELRKITAKLNIDFTLDYAIERHDLYKNGQTLGELLSNEDYRAQMEEAKSQGDIDKARTLSNKYIRQKKIRKLNEHYQMIFDNIINGTEKKYE